MTSNSPSTYEFSNITAGVNPDKSDALEVGVGFLNFDDATEHQFHSWNRSRQCVEFDYFPYFVDPVYGPDSTPPSPR